MAEMLSIDRLKMINSPEENRKDGQSQNQSLRACVKQALENYFANLGHAPANLYDLVLEEIEHPMLEVVMQKVRHNQCKAAILLGLSRGTLRKKLKHYGLDKR